VLVIFGDDQGSTRHRSERSCRALKTELIRYEYMTAVFFTLSPWLAGSMVNTVHPYTDITDDLCHLVSMEA
jgi:hypothetical protein